MLNSTEKFQGYNLIMVYNKDRTKLLFCKRKKDPYQGLYNFVGGKIDDGEDGFHGCMNTRKEIKDLHHLSCLS